MGAGCLSDNDRAYYLHDLFIQNKQVEITKEEFLTLKQCKESCSALRKVDELYGVSVYSFIELEKFLLEMCLNYSAGTVPLEDIEMFFADSTEQLNLKLINLLNAYRIFIEQTPSLLATAFPEGSDIVERYREACSKEYDDSLAYRIMHNLRNISVHGQLPAETMFYSWQNEYPGNGSNIEGPTRRRFTVDPYIRKNILINSSKCQGPVKEQLRRLDANSIDIKSILREYVAAVSRLYGYVKTESEGILDQSIQEFEKAYASFSETVGYHKNHIEAVETSNGNEVKVFLKQEFLRNLKKRRSRFGNMAASRRSYISNQITKRQDTFYHETEDVHLG